jgi:hypothetical protein
MPPAPEGKGDAKPKGKAKTAKEIWDEADETLRALDQSYLFTHEEAREFPQFRIHELTLGSLLGKGGFSGVSEIVEIQLDVSTAVDPSNGATTATSPSTTPDLPPPPHDDDDDDDENDPSLVPTNRTTPLQPQEGQLQKQQQQQNENNHNDHLDVAIARQFMSKYCLRRGSARYAIKRLKDDLSNIDRARGAVDLAIEIKFLSTLWHPNISTYLQIHTHNRLMPWHSHNSFSSTSTQFFDR